jgi:RNA-binding motif protein, X-linked 2
MNNIEAIRKLNESELAHGLAGGPGSWHARYAHSPVVYIGGLPQALTEGDVLSVFEQVGLVVHINLARDVDTGKPKGFCFLAFADARSAVLAVDNFNAVVLLGSTLRVDHVDKYKPSESGTDTLLASPAAAVGEVEPECAQESALPRAGDNDETDTAALGAAMRSAVPDDDEKTQLVMKRLAELRRKRTLDDTQTTNGAHRRDRGSRPSTHHIPPLSQSPRPEPPLTGPVLTPLEAGGMRRGMVAKEAKKLSRRQKEERKRHRAMVRADRQKRRIDRQSDD